MSKLTIPSRENFFLYQHVGLLLLSYKNLTGKNLIDPDVPIKDLAEKIYFASFALVSHGTEDDPVFNYGNKTALELFEMDWNDFTQLHSRKSAEPINREERTKLLKRVTEDGFINDYSGVRISSSGKRFEIKDAVVWNLLDEDGVYRGQAATFNNWKIL